MATIALEEMAGEVGRECVSDWLPVTQSMIDAFADATGDRQFIHVDPVRAAATPFGGTIAHGFLTLSLLPLLAQTADLPRPAGVRMGINAGAERLRFLAPVRSGARVRGRFRLLAFEARPPGQYRQATEVTVEIEGQDKPALVAEWLTRLFL